MFGVLSWSPSNAEARNPVYRAVQHHIRCKQAGRPLNHFQLCILDTTKNRSIIRGTGLKILRSNLGTWPDGKVYGYHGTVQICTSKGRLKDDIRAILDVGVDTRTFMNTTNVVSSTAVQLLGK